MDLSITEALDSRTPSLDPYKAGSSPSILYRAALLQDGDSSSKIQKLWSKEASHVNLYWGSLGQEERKNNQRKYADVAYQPTHSLKCQEGHQIYCSTQGLSEAPQAQHQIYSSTPEPQTKSIPSTPTIGKMGFDAPGENKYEGTPEPLSLDLLATQPVEINWHYDFPAPNPRTWTEEELRVLTQSLRLPQDGDYLECTDRHSSYSRY